MKCCSLIGPIEILGTSIYQLRTELIEEGHEILDEVLLIFYIFLHTFGAKICDRVLPL